MLRPNQVAGTMMRFMSSTKPFKTAGPRELNFLKKKFQYNTRHTFSYLNGGSGKVALVRLLQLIWPVPVVGYIMYGDRFGTVRK